jgi:hypothetical protein
LVENQEPEDDIGVERPKEKIRDTKERDEEEAAKRAKRRKSFEF